MIQEQVEKFLDGFYSRLANYTSDNIENKSLFAIKMRTDGQPINDGTRRLNILFSLVKFTEKGIEQICSLRLLQDIMGFKSDFLLNRHIYLSVFISQQLANFSQEFNIPITEVNAYMVTNENAEQFMIVAYHNDQQLERNGQPVQIKIEELTGGM